MGQLNFLNKYLLLVFLVFCALSTAHTQTLELKQTIRTDQQGTPYFWHGDEGGSAIDSDGDHLIYGAFAANYQGVFGGAVFILERSGNGWSETAMFTAPGFHSLGRQVAISGDYAFASAFEQNKVFIYKNTGGIWAENQVLNVAVSDLDFSNGKLAVVSFGIGAHIYENISGQWTETGTISPPSNASSDFGARIAIDNNELVISDANAVTSEGIGKVYHYQLNSGVWTVQNEINCPVSETAAFGLGLDFQGDYVAIAHTHLSNNGLNRVGKVYVYARNASNWTLDTEIIPEPHTSNYLFGLYSAVSIDGNTLMVGHFDQPGRAHVYKKENGVWVDSYPTTLANPEHGFAHGVFVKGDEYFIGSRSISIPGENTWQPVGGVYYWAPACAISNVTTTNIDCDGDNATFEVSFDHDYSSGSFEIYDTDNNVVLATGTSSPIQVTIAGPIAATTINYSVRDQGDNNCSSTGIANIQTCPSSPCSITASTQNGVCFSNWTYNDPTDDVYTLIYNSVSNSNAGASNQFTIQILGQTYGPFIYDISGQISGLPSNGVPFDIKFADLDNPDCTVTLTGLSQPCSTCPTYSHSYTSNSPVCEGETIVFTRLAGLGSYEWSGPNGFTSTLPEPQIGGVSVANAGTYSVTMTNYLGCTEVTTVDVVVTPALSNVNAGVYNDVCQGDGLIPLIGTPSGGTFTGIGVSANLFDPSIAGIGVHTLTYTVLDDCSGNPVVATSTIEVISVDGTAPVIANITICEGGDTEIFPQGPAPTDMHLWSELFDENGAGVTGPSKVFTPPSNGQWTMYGNFSKLHGATYYYKVTNESLTARRTRNKLCFESEPIDISGLQNVSFNIDISENGDLEPHDFVDVIYILDGTSTKIINWEGQGNNNHTLTGKNGANDADWGSTVVSIDGLTGSELIIKICARNNAGNEYINIDNIDISYTPALPKYFFYDADPANGNANLLAGPVTSYDPMTTVQNSPQTIWVAMAATNSCQSPATPVTVTVGENPIAVITGNSSTCEGATINLSETSTTSGLNWLWTGPNGFTATSQNISIDDITASNSGTYDVTITTPLQCSASASFDVNVLPTPPIPVVTDINICQSNTNTGTAIFPDYPNFVPFFPDFEEAGAGATGPNAIYTPPSDNSWSLSGPGLAKLTKANRYFKVANPGELEIRNTRKKICMETATIDIAGYTAGFEIDLEAIGNHKPGDFVDVFYIIDGVKTRIPNFQGQGNNNHTLTGKNGQQDWDEVNISMDNLVGNTLSVQLCIRLKGKTKYVTTSYFEIYKNLIQDYYFYDQDPASGTANLLAGPSKSYNPNTTPASSPQTIWVSAIQDICESEAVPVVITVGENPVAEITANTVTPCTNQSLTLSETSGVATNWSWTGPNGFTSSDQSISFSNVTANQAGLYVVAASTLPACSSTDTINITVLPDSIEVVPCFNLVIPWAGHTIDFSPSILNFYDADPTSGNANLLASGVSSYTFSPTDIVWITSGSGACESTPQQVIVNDPTDIHLFNPNNISFAEVMADYTFSLSVIPPSFYRLAFLVDHSQEIDIFQNFTDAVSNSNPIPYPYTVTQEQYVFYRYGDSLCPTICIAHLDPYVGMTSVEDGFELLQGQEMHSDVTPSSLDERIVLQQNYPNPFNQKTVIGFVLPQGGKATLRIFDVTGHLIHQIQSEYQKGQNHVYIDKSDLGKAGVLFYQLQTSKSTSTRRMLFIE